MWKNLDNPWALMIIAGAAVFLAFPKYDLYPLSIGFGFFFLAAARHFKSASSAFGWGLFVSLIIMLGGFYWVTYVLHTFGFLPWSVAALLFLGFCGFGALNFPLFSLAIYLWRGKSGVWFTLCYPALFTVIEYFCPKLFPWHLGHCLYRASWVNQIAEITGTSFLSFLIVSWGGAFYGLCSRSISRWFVVVPGILSALAILFSGVRLSQGPAQGRTLKVAVIQANIGSLDKVQARKDSGGKLKVINDAYIGLTERALAAAPDLLVWPETALAYRLQTRNPFAIEIEEKVKTWNVPLVTGAYAPGDRNPWNEFNAAYLIEPTVNGVNYDHYGKNVLLAFGEYMPFGDWFSGLYRAFPQVSNFERGTTQKAFELQGGIRIGISICYEMILPSFMRKVADNGVHLFVNLTNDSWFGPTSEPYLHGAISRFRAIEHRVPIIRSTNTGTSFIVNTLGEVGTMTPVYEEGILIEEVGLPLHVSHTIYGRMGDWFVALCAIGLVAYMMISKKRT